MRVTPAGGAPVERPGFCIDALHVIGQGINYSVSLQTAADDPRLATARYGEAAWLIQSAEGLIAAAAPSARSLESGALQTAVWQLTDQIRETNPSSDAVLNARTAALRALAAGKAVGGPLTMTPSMTRGCAGRSSVAVNLTGAPGSTADLSVASGAGTVSPAQVRFGADGTAAASVTSATAGVVAITARSQGGTITRLARSSASAQTPQETMVLVPQAYSATTTVTFEDCPVIPFEGPTTPTTPAAPVAPLDTPTAKPVVPSTPVAPQQPAQATPKFTLVKKGPARITAGARTRYTITVRNRGTSVLRNLTLTDVLPKGMSLTGTPSGARLRGGRVVWSVGALKARGSRTFRVNVRIDADISGRRCNRAIATAPGGIGSSAVRRTAKACTAVKALPRVLLPAVTA